MIIAFIPCRLQSSRFPNKALKLINGVASIERCLLNACAIPGIDKIILATTTNKEDDILETYNLNDLVEVIRGDENDVLQRFLPSIKKYKPEHVIRITGDCPLVSPELGKIIINSHLDSGADVSYTLSKVALGISFEIIKVQAIEKLLSLFNKTEHSEYLIYYFVNNPEYFSLNNIKAPEKFIRQWRLTLDEENDLELLNLIYKTLDVGMKPVLFEEVISYFDKYPDSALINLGNEVKYRDNKALVELLKKATTISK